MAKVEETLDMDQNTVGPQGHDLNVSGKILYPKTGGGTVVFIIFLFLLALIPGFIWLGVKASRQSQLQALKQKIQNNNSQVQVFVNQRADILQNASSLMTKSIDIDKTVFKDIAKARGGVSDNDKVSKTNTKLDKIEKQIRVAFEQYPNLKSHDVIADCLQQSSYLTKEITSARIVANETILQWNAEIFKWPTNKYIAGKNKWHTEIPWVASAEVLATEHKDFFK